LHWCLQLQNITAKRPLRMDKLTGKSYDTAIASDAGEDSLPTAGVSDADLTREQLQAELEVLRDRMAELEDLEIQRISEEHERFESLNVLDEYAQQLEVSRDKLARLLRAGVAIEEARDFHSILQTVADAVGAAGWASAVVYLFDNYDILDAAYFGVCDEDIVDLTKNRRSPAERSRMFSQPFDEFKVSRSYFIQAERLPEALGPQVVVPGRRETRPGDDWNPLDLLYVPMYSSTGQVLGNINCDDPLNGKRPNAEVIQYLEIFADLAARKIETVRLLNRQAQIESQLRESEKKYRTIFDRSADSFLLMDDLFRECNDATLRIFGCEYDDIVGHSPVEFSPKYQPDGQRSDKLAAEYISRAKQGHPQNFEWIHLRKDGVELNCEVSLAAIEVSGRNMIMAVVRDLSEKKRMARDKETSAIASQLFLSARSLDLVFSQLPKILVSRFSFEIAAIELYDVSSDELVLMGEENTGLSLGTRFPANMCVSGTVMRTGDPVVDPYAARRPDYAHAELRRIGLQRILCVPLRARDQIIGTLWLGDTRQAISAERAMVEMNQALVPLSVVANYLAHAIDRQHAEDELTDLKLFFENLLDNIPAQISVYDTDGNYRYANIACAGNEKTRVWAIGHSDHDMHSRNGLPVDIARQRSSAIVEAVEKGERVTFEERLRDEQDREHYYLKVVSPVRSVTGEIDHVISYGFDITDTKLWEQEQRLISQLPTDNPFPVLTCGADARIQYMNAAADQLAERLGTKDPLALLPPDHPTIVEMLAVGCDSRAERSVVIRGSMLNWIYCKRPGGSFQIYGVELLDYPHAKPQSQIPNQITSALLSGYSSPVWLIDIAGNEIETGGAATELLASLGCESLRKICDVGTWQNILSVRGSSLEVNSFEAQYQSRAWKWHVTQITEQLKLVELEDISEFRDLQEKLRHAQKMEALGRLAGGIAHDFNNLLTAIIGNLELLERTNSAPSSARDCAREAGRAAEQAALLVKQLLNYSRKSPDDIRTVDPNDVCSTVVKMLRRTIDRRVALVESFEPDVWPIAADPNQIEQILMNLGVNAADAVADKIEQEGGLHFAPQISISVRNAPATTVTDSAGRSNVVDCVAISVGDNGGGIPAQIQKRIFDAYFTTKTANRGTGLGLSIVQDIVRSLSGFIELKTDQGKGSTFTFYLPKSENAPVVRNPHAPKLNIRGGTETILLVDDEPVILDIGQEVLTQAGYTVLLARDGRESVQIFEQNMNAIDLVIMDISLPVMSGDDAVALMLDMRDDLPIILSSGLPDAASERRKILLGSVAFIQKPYRPTELLGSIREVLDHAKEQN